jgi:transcriptional regulator with XRE-family HTH domain/Zn-dependent peptidase ImmA (M78 family)
MSLNIPVIFGMKLKKFREAQGLSLTDFALRCELSASYVTEIERGRKYPKTEKIVRMAQVLGRNYDELVSLKLSAELEPLEGFFASPILKDFPFHFFGIAQTDLLELMTRSPSEAAALVEAMVDIAASYQVGVEHLFRAALRAYQERKQNYFEDIEEAVEEFDTNYGYKALPNYTYEQLAGRITELYNYEIGTLPVEKHPQLAVYRSVLVPNGHPKLLINPRLNPAQCKFILAREIGYQFLGLKTRALTSAPDKVESFEQVLNDFKASYFAGALLIKSQAIRYDLARFFTMTDWQPQMLLSLLEKYDVTPEILFYRMSEIMARFFNLKVHFLRYNEEQGHIKLVKQFNMTRLLVPGGLGLVEHHCRRWLALRLLRQLRSSRKPSNHPVVGVQISTFTDNPTAKFLCFGLARPLTLNRSAISSVTIGIKFDPEMEKTIKFWQDKKVPRVDVGTSCERCPLLEADCKERVVPPTILERLAEGREREEILRHLIQQ